MSEFLNLLDNIEEEARTALDRAVDRNALESASNAFLGRKGRLADLSRQLGTLDNETRPKAGARLNEIRKSLAELAETKTRQFTG